MPVNERGGGAEQAARFKQYEYNAVRRPVESIASAAPLCCCIDRCVCEWVSSI